MDSFVRRQKLKEYGSGVNRTCSVYVSVLHFSLLLSCRGVCCCSVSFFASFMFSMSIVAVFGSSKSVFQSRKRGLMGFGRCWKGNNEGGEEGRKKEMEKGE